MLSFGFDNLYQALMQCTHFTPWRMRNPTKPMPANIIAQVSASGTGADAVAVTEMLSILQ